MIAAIANRLRNKIKREISCRFARAPFPLQTDHPLISFTFDDFPVTAAEEGAAILERHGARGTFYLTTGLMNRESPVGRIAGRDHVSSLLDAGHEIGGHTADHRDAWRTPRDTFRTSVEENGRALARLFPKAVVTSFAYPIDYPRPANKRTTGRYYATARGGGQTANFGATDLRLLLSFFLDARTRDSFDHIRRLIDETIERRGWLIFSTHDVSPEPSRFGYPGDAFERIVRYAAESPARILPVDAACRTIGVPNTG